VHETYNPTWDVISVFDPDGTGSDFAYTVGLADHNVSELHVWARPTDGTDVGLDFKLSPRDMQALLNRCALQLLDGELTAGSRFTETFDGGLCHADFTVGDVVTRDSVDAFQADETATVLPLRWELFRDPEGDTVAVDDETACDIQAAALRWRGVAEDVGADHETLAAFGDIRTDPGQQCGPWGAVVTAVSAAVLAQEEKSVYDLGVYASYVRHDLLAALGVIQAVARPHGRTQAVNDCLAEARTDAAKLVDTAGDLFEGLSPHDGEMMAGAMERALGVVLGVAYAGWAVKDLIDETVFETATGVVSASCDSDGANDRFWDNEQVAPVAERASKLETGDLAALASAVEAGGDSFLEALWWGRAVAVIAGLGCPTTTGEIIDDDIGDAGLGWDVFDQACDAIDAAGLAVLLAGRHQERVEALQAPWQAVTEAT
jgi:hypothetical protein